jgi:hypothetical protein
MAADYAGNRRKSHLLEVFDNSSIVAQTVRVDHEINRLLRI